MRDSFAASERLKTTYNRVAGLDRNGWPTSVGTGGRFASELVAALARITQWGETSASELERPRQHKDTNLPGVEL